MQGGVNTNVRSVKLAASGDRILFFLNGFCKFLHEVLYNRHLTQIIYLIVRVLGFFPVVKEKSLAVTKE
jgi:hypothetical protein